jgi:hypothetical protein
VGGRRVAHAIEDDDHALTAVLAQAELVDIPNLVRLRRVPHRRRD